MVWKVLIVHAPSEESYAEILATPIQQAGYDVSHRGTVEIGASIEFEVNAVLAAGGPVVICGTQRTVGSRWANHLVNAARSTGDRQRVFIVQMEKDAYVEVLAQEDKFARYCEDRDTAIGWLIQALQKNYPLEPVTDTWSLASGSRHVIPFLPPPSPDRYIDREKFLTRLKNALLPSRNAAHPFPTRAVLHGPAGIGKTSIAIAFAHDPEVRRDFPDGVLWARLGQTADALPIQRTWGRVLGDDQAIRGNYPDLITGTSQLRTFLQDRACLLVVDDAWESEAVENAFLVGGTRCLLLITSRQAKIARKLQASIFELEGMDEEESLALFERWSGSLSSSDQITACWLAKEVGYLPLALELIAAQVSRMGGWNEYKARWESQRLTALIRHRKASGPEDNFLDSLELSVNALSDVDRSAYLQLGVFCQEEPIPIHAAAALWDKDEIDAADFLLELADQALLSKHTAGDKKVFVLHALLYDYAVEASGEEGMIRAHQALLRGYIKRCPEGWWSGPDDGYFFQNLIHHLRCAGQYREISQLLQSFGWLEAKLEHTDIMSLIQDYSQALDSDSPLLPTKLFIHIRTALLNSRFILHQNRHELAAQLLARLDHEEVPGLLVEARARSSTQWFWPETPSLAHADFLHWHLRAHLKGIIRVARLGSSARIIAISDDGTLSGWDLKTGKELFRLHAHAGKVTSLTVAQDNRFALSTASDGEAIVWDLSVPVTIYSINNQDSFGQAAACTPDGKEAIVAYNTGAYQLIHLDDGQHQILGYGPESWVKDLVFVEQDVMKALYKNGQVVTWRIKPSFSKISEDPGYSDASAVATDPRQRALAIGHATGELSIHDRNGLQTTSINTAQGGPITYIAWVDVEKILSITANTTLQVWSLKSGQELLKLPYPPGLLYSACVSGDFIATACADGSIDVLNRNPEGNTYESAHHLEAVTTITYTGTTCITAGRDGQVAEWDPVQYKQKTNRYVDGCYITSAVFLAREQSVALGTNDGRVYLCQPGGDNQMKCIYKSASNIVSIYAMCWVESKCDLAFAQSNNKIMVYHGNSQKTDALPRPHTRLISSLTLFDDDRRMISASHDGFLKVWSTENWQMMFPLSDKNLRWTSVAVSADNKTAVAASLDGQIVVWDLESQQRIHGWRASDSDQQGVNAVRILTIPNTIITISDDCTVRAWDFNGKEIGRFSGDSPFTSCELLSKHQILVAGDKAGRVYFLHLAGS